MQELGHQQESSRRHCPNGQHRRILLVWDRSLPDHADGEHVSRALLAESCMLKALCLLIQGLIFGTLLWKDYTSVC